MFKVKSSTLVSVLVAISIFSLIILVILTQIAFFGLNYRRDLNVKEGEWFLQGRVQEFFDALINGGSHFSEGRFDFTYKNENEMIPYTIEIDRKQKNLNSLKASLKWKNKYDISYLYEYLFFPLYDYVLFYGKDYDSTLGSSVFISGKIGSYGDWKAAAQKDYQIYLYRDSSMDYFQNMPDLKALTFTNSPHSLFSNKNFTFPSALFPSSIRFSRQTEKVNLPTIEKIWNVFSHYKDSAFIIDRGMGLPVKKIVNPFLSEKDLIGIGDGVTTRFSIDRPSINRVYIKKITKNSDKNKVPSLVYSYGEGDINKGFFQVINKKIHLKASEEILPIIVPNEAYGDLGTVYLRGKDYSAIGAAENIENLFIVRVNLVNELIEGSDFEYYPETGELRFISTKFFHDYVEHIGTGDGVRKTFPLTHFSIPIIYVGKKRVDARIGGGIIELTTPPPYGADVLGFRPPPLFIKKYPPMPNDGVYIDKEEEACILDLDLSSPPRYGVIFSKLPLIVKGEAAFPTAILSTENIYLENINSKREGKPVLIISGKGVWAFQNTNENSIILNRVYICSPLDGIYLVKGKEEMPDPTINIFGGAFFSMEKNDFKMENLRFLKANFFYDSFLTNDIELENTPFMYFPRPFLIKKIMRLE